jgi:hypothetical protein
VESAVQGGEREAGDGGAEELDGGAGAEVDGLAGGFLAEEFLQGGAGGEADEGGAGVEVAGELLVVSGEFGAQGDDDAGEADEQAGPLAGVESFAE